MKIILAVLISLTTNLSAQWLVLKPTEFEPLTKLPWEHKDTTLESVLGAIFRDPNLAIRRFVLAEYLRQIPVENMGKAFDVCVPLEGTQNPDDLVALFIPIWVERDPLACWEWVKKLFHVTGVENDVLGYDSWNHPRITVHDLAAIRASTFWLTSRALQGFPLAIDSSKLPKGERVRIMKEFMEMWFNAFSFWPRSSPLQDAATYSERRDSGAQRALLAMLSDPLKPETLSSIKTWIDNSSPVQDVIHEIALRRMLQENSKAAPELVKQARERKSQSGNAANRGIQEPSDEVLLIWGKSDLPGAIHWAESLDDHDLADRAKGLLMSLGDKSIRTRWLREARTADSSGEREAALFQSWAKWDPKGALEAAAKAENPESTSSIANSAVYGPGFSQPWNQSRYACSVLSTFDYSKLPPKIHEQVFADCYSLMEQWDSIDVASAAQFGFAYLLRTHYAPREGLIRFFSGDDIYGGEDGMIDRTFCALRVWAVIRPDEMRKWIGTIKDVEMRNALTWLLENPWGTGKEE